MLAWILEHGGLEPGFLIGGVPQDFGVSARLSDTPFFVIEADEYDTAFFDKRSKFVHYPARTAILNNLEFDHADIFPDLAAIETQFHHFVRTLPESALIVTNGADAGLERVLARGCWSEVERFDFADGWRAGARDAKGAFEVYWQGQKCGTLKSGLTGAHNRSNALAAIAAARHAGVPPEVAIEALARFQGVKRRMEVRGVVRGITVYDDFAHHPTAIETTLAGLRANVDGARIIAVVEPRSNTMKLGVMRQALPRSLALRIAFSATAAASPGTRPPRSPLGDKAVVSSDLEQLIAEIARESRSGDHVLIMSNGGFGGIHEKLLEASGGKHERRHPERCARRFLPPHARGAAGLGRRTALGPHVRREGHLRYRRAQDRASAVPTGCARMRPRRARRRSCSSSSTPAPTCSARRRPTSSRSA